MNDDPAATTRLFFAIVPDAAARGRLDELARAAAIATGGRASAPATLHLTVVFVGSVADAAVDEVRRTGSSIGWPACELALDALGSFTRTGVAWAAPLAVPAAILSAQHALVAKLADRGLPTEERPWRPHVTLARRCAQRLDGSIAPPIAWRVERVVLMASRLADAGAHYREIDAWTVR
ncbi:MAG: RNA 2',3'-cyclic phosphodiesterase [Betaproteobacteria bacterium]